MKKQKKGDPTFRGCIVCKYGHFIEELPLQGECRFNPPRAISGKNGASEGRHFVHVRFDDWCGRLQEVKSDQTSAQFEKLRPYLSTDQMSIEAQRTLNSGDFALSLKLFDQLFQGDQLNVDMLNEISETLRKSLGKDPNDDNLMSSVITWQRRAADRGHPEACYSFAITLVKREYSILDETLSREYLLKSAKLGHEMAIKRVASDDFFKNDVDSGLVEP